MSFDVEMPDGTIISDVPEGTTKEQIMAKYNAMTGKQQPSKGGLLDFLPKGTPSWMVSKPGQGWDDANASLTGGDVTNPMAYLSEAQKTEQGPTMQAVSQGVNRATQIGAGVAKGAIINPVAAVAQVTGETGRQFAEEAQKSYSQQRKTAGAEGFDWAELGGALVSPVNRVIPGGAMTTGAVSSMLQPVEGENLTTFDVLAGKAQQAATGAILGRVAENLIGALTPKLKAGTQELMDRGVQVSPGQAYEGVPGWLFRQLEDLKLDKVILLGQGPKKEEVAKQFNNVVANDVVSSIGQEISKNVPAGQASVRLVQRRISNYYDDALTGLGKNKFDLEYKQGVAQAIKDSVSNISDVNQREFVAKKLTNSLNANIGSRVDSQGIDGKNIKKVQEWLKDEITKVDGKSDVVNTSLKSGYADVLANLNQFVSRVDVDGKIAKADAAWAKLYSYADASKRAVQKGGVFTPGQLADAAQAQANTVLQAGGGRVALGPESQKYVEVLGKQEPLSLFGKAMLASKLFTGAATTVAAPAIAGPILIASGMTYAAANQLMKNPSATRLAVQKILQKNPGLFGLAGTRIWEDMSRQAEQGE